MGSAVLWSAMTLHVAGALVGVPGGSRLSRPTGHVISGVPIAGAGVVPYVDLPGRGIHFLLQGLTNGTRAGKLSDFGGRREESDKDTFFTAAREFCEETDFVFGTVDELASSLRSSSTVRILNRQGRYVCFFLKVEYLPAGMVTDVDGTSDEPTARDVRWWRADELLGIVPEDRILARMMTSSELPGMLPTGPASSRPTLSAFHRAVYKTLNLENAHQYAHERWHSTVLSTLDAASRRREADSSRARRYQNALVAALRTPAEPPAPRKGGPYGGSKSSSRGGGGKGAAARNSGGSGSGGDKRGSRRGPPKVASAEVPWHKEQRWAGSAGRGGSSHVPRKRGVVTKTAAAKQAHAPVKRKQRSRPMVEAEMLDVAVDLPNFHTDEWYGFSA